MHPRAVFVAPHEPLGVRVHTDPYMLTHILLNLLDNAAKYGGEAPTVVVSTVGDARTVRIVVTDDGPGIPASERGSVFERFHRGSTARGPGSGLGLYIVRRLAEALSANVELAESPCGTSFQVSLPISSVGDPPDGGGKREPAPAAAVEACAGQALHQRRSTHGSMAFGCRPSAG